MNDNDLNSVLETRKYIRYLINSSSSNSSNIINDQNFWKEKYELHFGILSPERSANVTSWFQMYQYESNRRILYVNSEVSSSGEINFVPDEDMFEENNENYGILNNFIEFSISGEEDDYPDSQTIKSKSNFQYREVYFGKVITMVKIYKNMICIIDSDNHLWIGGIDIEEEYGFTEKLGGFSCNVNILAKNVYIGQYIIFYIDLQNKLNSIGKKSKYLHYLDSKDNKLFEFSEETLPSPVTSTFPTSTPTFPTSTPTFPQPIFPTSTPTFPQPTFVTPTFPQPTFVTPTFPQPTFPTSQLIFPTSTIQNKFHVASKSAEQVRDIYNTQEKIKIPDLSQSFYSITSFSNISNIYITDEYCIIVTDNNNKQQLFLLGNKNIFFPKYNPEHLYIVVELKFPFILKDVILTNETALFLSTENDLWIIGETPLLFITPEIPTIWTTVTKLETPKIKEIYYDGLNSLILDIHNQIWITTNKVKNMNIIKLFTPDMLYNNDNISRYVVSSLNKDNNFISVKNGLIDKYGSPWDLFSGVAHSELDNITEIVKSSFGVDYFEPFTVARRKNIILVTYQQYMNMKNSNNIKQEYYCGNYIQFDYYNDIRKLYFTDNFGSDVVYCVPILYNLKTGVITELQKDTYFFRQQLLV